MDRPQLKCDLTIRAALQRNAVSSLMRCSDGDWKPHQQTGRRPALVPVAVPDSNVTSCSWHISGTASNFQCWFDGGEKKWNFCYLFRCLGTKNTTRVQPLVSSSWPHLFNAIITCMYCTVKTLIRSLFIIVVFFYFSSTELTELLRKR